MQTRVVQQWNALCFDDVHAYTGFEPPVLEYIFNKYCGIDSPILNRKQLVQIYQYMHQYPVKSQTRGVLKSNDFHFHHHIKPDLHYLTENINEIFWDDRLSPLNHAHHFPTLVTGMVDTFPVYVSQPEDRELAKALYNPKYDGCVYKFQLGIDFLGRIMIFSGPHLGTVYDGDIWKNTNALHLFEDWEIWIGDGHYISCPQLLCPFREPQHRSLNEDELMVNAIISHYRARVEHTNKLMERHNILGHRYRGGYELLQDAAHLLAHTTNVMSYMYPRYPPVGPWSHQGI